jgi:alpha-tubulin suppressor-like RCC1 family protein
MRSRSGLHEACAALLAGVVVAACSGRELPSAKPTAGAAGGDDGPGTPGFQQGAAAAAGSLAVSLSASSTASCPGQCVELTPQIRGGIAPYTVRWSDGSTSVGGTREVCPTATTTYTAVVTDSSGNSGELARPDLQAQASVTIAVTPGACAAKPAGEADTGAGPGLHPAGPTLAVGGDHSCALRGGKLECWGENWGGELGIGVGSGPQSCDMRACSLAPVAVTGLSAPVDSVAAGDGETCVLLAGGTVACWGANDSGQLGDGSTSGPELCLGQLPCSTTPGVVSGVSGATAVATSGSEACAVLSSGAVECWGSNLGGELGYETDGSSASGYPVSSVPTMVSGLTQATAVGVGSLYACALLRDGTIQCWGTNASGQLGNGSTTDSTTPVQVSDVTGAAAIAVGGGHTCALMADGTVVCWGGNDYGELGLARSSSPQACVNNDPCATTPVKVPNLSGVMAIAAGLNDTCALLSDATVRCWGWNDHGQLGDGTTMDSSTPAIVSGLSGVSAIAMGDETACALVSSGDVVCWGNNTDGQLGSAPWSGPSLSVAGPQSCNGDYPCSTTPRNISGL